jgi:hypothetical protein
MSAETFEGWLAAWRRANPQRAVALDSLASELSQPTPEDKAAWTVDDLANYVRQSEALRVAHEEAFAAVLDAAVADGLTDGLTADEVVGFVRDGLAVEDLPETGGDGR